MSLSNKSPQRLPWGGRISFLERSRRIDWVDLSLLIALSGILFGFVHLAREWTGVMRPTVEIDLSPLALPKYAFFSLSRGLIAYVISLTFSLAYGYWAAKDALAQKVLIPLLDILQSVPVLGFMPGLVLALVAIFPGSNIGLELAAVIMIFTGQAWNMTFSFYNSMRSIPHDQNESARIFRFSTWQRFKWVELPSSTMGLVWNSMMSMAGGWFFLMINEAFVLGDHDFRLPGIGSYMSVAVAKGNIPAMIWAIAAMALMIVLLDQLLWRPVVTWAQKFRTEEGSQEVVATSWFLDWLHRSQAVHWLRSKFARHPRPRKPRPVEASSNLIPIVLTRPRWAKFISTLTLILLVGAGLVGLWKLVHLFPALNAKEWGSIFLAAVLTLSRVLAATFLGTLWAVPAGLAVGLSPRLSRTLQPVSQVLASFPAPMLFPAAIALLSLLGVSLGFGSILLMLLGTQWYIFFNVIAGAMAIPADLREAARSYRLTRWDRFIQVYLPAVFPYLITGWVTAAGGGWNASIVAEYVMYKGELLSTRGIGALISQAASKANFPMLAASVLVLAVFVIAFNRTVWQRLYRLAQSRYSLTN